MVILGKVSTPLPAAIPNINRKSWLKILGITLDSENVPDNLELNETYQEVEFDCNSISHQSGTEELYEKRVRAYLGNIQRNVSANRSTERRSWEREGISYSRYRAFNSSVPD